jgi:hypothetical protein
MADQKVKGTCALCQQVRELRRSHFLPAALYRLVRAANKPKPDPILSTATGQQQTSHQAWQHLLCCDCEGQFNRNGESWVMRHCYRGRGRFRLRDIVERCKPIHTEANELVYSALSEPSINIDQLVYFCTSVSWRASVRDWIASGQKYQAISLGKAYQEQIRKYLLGEREFPQNAAVTVILSQLKFPHLAFNFPDTVRVQSCHCHTLHIPGMTFQLMLGKHWPEGTHECCILRSPFNPIFVCKDGDARVQRNILRLMGKTDTSWGKYPLIEGFENLEFKK